MPMRLSVQMKIIGAPPGALFFLEQKIAERKNKSQVAQIF